MHMTVWNIKLDNYWVEKGSVLWPRRAGPKELHFVKTLLS